MVPVKVGVVGCGAEGCSYLRNVSAMFSSVEFSGIFDKDMQRAEAAGAEFGIKKVYSSLEGLLNDREIEIVLDLTPQDSHFEVSLAAVEAGKHVYIEKLPGLIPEENFRIFEAARIKNVLVGASPDTILGSGIQTCRKFIDDGYIGSPSGALVHVCPADGGGNGISPWLRYGPGENLMKAVAPYYITALVTLLGSVKSVSGMSKGLDTEWDSPLGDGGFSEAVLPAYTAGLMQFECGVIGSLLTSSASRASGRPGIEVYGSRGAISISDPCLYGGEVRLYRAECGQYLKMPPVTGYSGDCRGLGLSDMADAVQGRRQPRASGELACHVSEIIAGIINSCGAHVDMHTRAVRPDAMVKSRLSEMFE